MDSLLFLYYSLFCKIIQQNKHYFKYYIYLFEFVFLFYLILHFYSLLQYLGTFYIVFLPAMAIFSAVSSVVYILSAYKVYELLCLAGDKFGITTFAPHLRASFLCKKNVLYSKAYPFYNILKFHLYLIYIFEYCYLCNLYHNSSNRFCNSL